MKRFLACLLLSVLVSPVEPLIAQSRPDLPGSRQPVRLSTSRIAPLPESQWTDQHRELVREYAPDGRVGNALSTLLHVPELAEAIMRFVRFLDQESALEARDRSLLLLRTAWLTHSQYHWSVFAAAGREAGLTDAELRRIAVGPDADGWNDFDAAHLRLADELYRNSSVTDQTWTTLGVRYNLLEMFEAVMNVNEFTLLSMMFNSMGVQPNDWTTDRLPTDVAYRISTPDREPPLQSPRMAPLEGNGLRVSRTFNRHPGLAAARGGQGGFVLRGSPLTDHDRELLILRIGWNTQAEYEWAKHVGSVGRARDHGLEPLRIAEGPGADGWSPFSVRLLTLADELYRDAMVSDETWGAITAEFDTREAIAALMTVSNYRLVSMSLNAFGVQILPTDERFPDVR
jgi:alkylhydroperoxidase family enzyme